MVSWLAVILLLVAGAKTPDLTWLHMQKQKTSKMPKANQGEALEAPRGRKGSSQSMLVNGETRLI